MPLPLIPALFLGGSIVAGLKGLIDTTSAISEMQTLREDYQKRRAQYEQHERRYKEYWHLVEEHSQALGRLRLQALVTLSEAAKLLKKARLKDRNLFEEFKASPDQLTILEIESLKAIEVLDGTAKSVSAGVATATAVYGLAQALGTASTGTAISTLSGAAATNATLAWLGGGALAAGGGGMALGTAVLGGLVTGPALLAAGFFMSEKLEKVKTEVAKQMAEMDVAESAMEKQMAELDVIHARIDELQRAMMKFQDMLQDALANADLCNLNSIFKVVKLAKALATLLDVKVLDLSSSIPQVEVA